MPWFGGYCWLMAPNEEVVGYVFHIGVVLTTVVHPTMVGVLGPCCIGTSKPFGGIPCLVS